MAKITTKAYIPSATEYESLKEKHPAFAAVQPSKKALEAGVATGANWNDQCSFILRTATMKIIPTAGNAMKAGYLTGESRDVFSDNDQCGLVVAISLIYDPSSEIVKNCKHISYGAYMTVDAQKQWIISGATIVTFGGNTYIWTNKEECENGSCQVMNLISQKALDRALPISHDGSHNDFTQADTLHAQCEIAAFENATDEEMEMVVPVELSSDDGCEKLTYKFTEKQKEILKKNQSAEIEKAM